MSIKFESTKQERSVKMKLAVVGSMNIDMTVCAERIPKKGETLMGTSLTYSQIGRAHV